MIKKVAVSCTTLLLVLTAILVLSACIGVKNISDVDYSKEPINVRDAMNKHKGLWFGISMYDSNDSSNIKEKKDYIVSFVLDVDGNGNATTYASTSAIYNYSQPYKSMDPSFNPVCMRLGDICDKSDDQILAMAKDNDKKGFDQVKELYTKSGSSELASQFDGKEYEEPTPQPVAFSKGNDKSDNLSVRLPNYFVIVGGPSEASMPLEVDKANDYTLDVDGKYFGGISDLCCRINNYNPETYKGFVYKRAEA